MGKVYILKVKSKYTDMQRVDEQGNNQRMKVGQVFSVNAKSRADELAKKGLVEIVGIENVDAVAPQNEVETTAQGTPEGDAGADEVPAETNTKKKGDTKKKSKSKR